MPESKALEAPLPRDALPERLALAGLLLPVLLMLVLSAISRRDGSAEPIALTDAVLAQGLAIELGLTATVGFWLWRKGWRPLRTATLPLDPRDLPRGMALWLGAILSVACWAVVCRTLFPNLFQVAKQTEMLGAPHLGVSFAFSMFNAVFEELLWLGLGFAAFQRFGLAAAGTVSAGLRLLAHGYQGPLALVTVLPIAVLFTVYYARTRRLWPIVVAHAFQDTLALSLLAGTGGAKTVGENQSLLFRTPEHQLNEPTIFGLGDEVDVVPRLQHGAS